MFADNLLEMGKSLVCRLAA